MEPLAFESRDTARDFYDARYQQGYMDAWPAWKKQRVFELLRSLPLPDSGTALDFGCGCAEFTGVIAQALPGWRVVGADISTTAVAKAAERYPTLTFHVLGSEQLAAERFDLVFTHHVL